MRLGLLSASRATREVGREGRTPKEKRERKKKGTEDGRHE
jgi:hypothetical protein